MPKVKRIFFVSRTHDYTDRLVATTLRKEVKGFIRLGLDTQVFSYNNALLQASPVKSRKFAGRFYKSHVDDLLVKQIKSYNPDVVHVSFAKFLDAETVRLMREAAPDAFFIGADGDIWPELHKNLVEAAKQLNMVMTTYAGRGLEAYEKAGIQCVFRPNMCDPDIEHRYKVSHNWRSNILFTGQIKYKRYPTEDIRIQIINRLACMENCVLYGCCSRPKVGGINYFYAISGARIGLSINADNSIRLYHSDRLTQYLACGTFVLAKRVPDSDLLFRDGIHLKYFDTVEEFCDLADWYLSHEGERIKIANAGMHRVHTEFNCERMAKYTIDLIEKGSYSAPWTT